MSSKLTPTNVNRRPLALRPSAISVLTRKEIRSLYSVSFEAMEIESAGKQKLKYIERYMIYKSASPNQIHEHSNVVRDEFKRATCKGYH